MPDETKTCEVCEATVGKTEVKCPACGVEFEALEEEVGIVTRAMTVAEKRRKAKEATPEPAPTPQPQPITDEPKKKSIFRSLALRK